MKKLAILGAIVALIAVMAYIAVRPFSGIIPDGDPNTIQMKIGRAEFEVLIADEPEEQAVGLSNRDSINENTGMFFVFAQEVTPAFWMKGMRFDLDFIWINGDTVIDITENVSHRDQEQLYRPLGPVTGVLEVLAGEARRKGVGIGDRVVVGD